MGSFPHGTPIRSCTHVMVGQFHNPMWKTMARQSGSYSNLMIRREAPRVASSARPFAGLGIAHNPMAWRGFRAERCEVNFSLASPAGRSAYVGQLATLQARPWTWVGRGVVIRIFRNSPVSGEAHAMTRGVVERDLFAACIALRSRWKTEEKGPNPPTAAPAPE